MKVRKCNILYKQSIPGYGTVRVLRLRMRGEKVRVLTVGRAAQSAVYIKKPKKEGLPFDYMNGFDWICSLLPEAGAFYMIGGGGFAYPRHFCSRWPEKRMDVSELRPEMLPIAEKYLDFNPSDYPNLRIFTGDGLGLLHGRPGDMTDEAVSFTRGEPAPPPSETLYDAIINDAFTGRSPFGQLTEEDAVRTIKEHLMPGGIYCINLATALRGPFSYRTMRQLKILRNYFTHTLLLPMDESKSAFSPQNCLLFASGREFRYFAD